jgi:hypothetical protein
MHLEKWKFWRYLCENLQYFIKSVFAFLILKVFMNPVPVYLSLFSFSKNCPNNVFFRTMTKMNVVVALMQIFCRRGHCPIQPGERIHRLGPRISQGGDWY